MLCMPFAQFRLGIHRVQTELTHQPLYSLALGFALPQAYHLIALLSEMRHHPTTAIERRFQILFVYYLT